MKRARGDQHEVTVRSRTYVEARDALAALLREHQRYERVVALKGGELVTLNFDYYRIGYDGAEIVADFLKHETVSRVYLSFCKIRPRGCKAVADALKHNQTVEYLNLDENPIGYEGAEAVIDALNYNVCIKELDVSMSVMALKFLTAIKYLTQTRNKILIPAAVRRASLYLIAARRVIADAGVLAIFPKEIVRMIAMEVWATRKEPIWINALSESERTGK